MLAGLQTKQLDGFATSLPFTTDAVVTGGASRDAGERDDVGAPDLLPFAYGLIAARPDKCAKEREKCVRIVRALAAANRMILETPDQALEILKKRFNTMDQQVLAAAWQTVAKAHAKDLHVDGAGLDHSQKVSIEAKLLEAKQRAEELRRALYGRVRAVGRGACVEAKPHLSIRHL